MMTNGVEKLGPSTQTLRVYLLPPTSFDAALTLQRRLVYDFSGDRDGAALILCEHPPLITVGRDGSAAHIACDQEDMHSRQWQVRWVNRGGGCLLHLPGQTAVYPILPLDRLGLGVHNYMKALQDVFTAVLDDFSVRAESRPSGKGVWVNGRMAASIGVAVRDWISYFGAAFNVDPDLELLRLVKPGAGELPMTSLVRERRGAVGPALVRQRLVEHFAERFGFANHVVFSDHSLLRSAKPRMSNLLQHS